MATTPRPLADYFAELRDPRVQLKCVHNFMDIILIVVCATIGGADDFVSVAQFAQAKKKWFRDRLGLQLDNGIPSHDTLNRVFAIIHPTQFRKCFLGWVESMSDRLKLKQIPIDGKAMRGSKRKTSAGSRTVQIVSAWSSENGVTLAQVRTDEKSNEVTAIPELLALLDISEALVRYRRGRLPEGHRRADRSGSRGLPVGGQGEPTPALRGHQGSRSRSLGDGLRGAEPAPDRRVLPRSRGTAVLCRA